MKKINTILLSLATLLAANLSAQVDVGITDVKVPANNSSYITGLVPAVTLEFTITNNSTTALSVADGANLKVAVVVNGAQVGNLANGPANFTLAARASVTLYLQNYNLSAALSKPSNTFCMTTVHPSDVDNSNDTTCNTVTLSTPTLNIKSQSISISAPTAIMNELELGTSVTEMKFRMQNNSSVDIPTGTAIPYGLYIGSDVKSVTGTLAAEWKIGTSTTRTISNTQIIPALPTVLGSFELCAYTRLAAPGINDTTCNTYKMVGFAFDSFAPSTGKTGDVVTISGAGFDATLANNIVKFNGVAATVKSGTTNSLVVEAPASTTGKITLEINGKTKTSGLDFRYLVADAIIDLTEITERVYYNSNILTYEFSEAALLNNLSLNIYSSTGQLVMTKDISESSDKTIQIDVSELPSGVYISDLKGSSFKFSK